MIEIFTTIKDNLPEHRLFTVDTPQRSSPTLLSILKSLINPRLTGSSQIVEPYSDQCFLILAAEGYISLTDFLQLQKIYNDINKSSRSCEVEDISDFVEKWMSPNEIGTRPLTNREKPQLEDIRNSTLATLHST